jgi:Niemann-Pick C1 protein
MQYWRSDLNRLLADKDVKKTATCVAPPDATERVCFDKIGVPVMQFTIFGGLNCEVPKKNECAECRVKASGMTTTFLLYNNDYSTKTAMEWEKNVFIRNIKSFNKAMGDEYHTQMMEGVKYNEELIDQIKRVQQKYLAQGINLMNLKADYLSERSIPDNISEESSENAFVIVISYILMFLYVGCAIGHLPSKVHSKFSLGFAGIFVVIASLIAAIGLTFFFNDKLTMISAEVVPFLILAIGVDNMFLISRAEKVVPPHVEDPAERIGYAMKEIGPSIFVAAFCEALAFFIGMQTDIPALQSFCLVAGLSVITDFFFQITVFLPALALDQMRIKDNRYDVLCCLKDSKKTKPREDLVRKYFNLYFVPFVFEKVTMMLTLAITFCLIVIGSFSAAKLLRGLNQNVSLVSGSDIFDFFETLFVYGNAGPPGYVVFNNVNYTDPKNFEQMQLISSELSALNDTIISPVYSWVGPFNNFISTGAWSEDCNSAYASQLSFDDQMKLFT